MAAKLDEKVEVVICQKGSVIVEIDPVDLGEEESVSEGGIVKPVGTGKKDGSEPTRGIVIYSAVGGVEVGQEVIFDRIDGFRFESEGCVLMSIYGEHVRAMVSMG